VEIVGSNLDLQAGSKFEARETRSERLPCCDHAIAADCVGVEPKRQLDSAAAKPILHSLWIGSDPDEK